MAINVDLSFSMQMDIFNIVLKKVLSHAKAFNVWTNLWGLVFWKDNENPVFNFRVLYI